jgi:hypothetical protein
MGNVMKQFDIFFTYVQFLENDEGKKRPVLILEMLFNKKEIILAPVYSYKKWFDNDSNAKKILYEIKDLEITGLIKRSFIDISRSFVVANKEIDNKNKIGNLSKNDIVGLLIKYNSLKF